MARSGQTIWLSGGIGTLRIFLGKPPRGTAGKPVPPQRFATELRAWIAGGVGANHTVWIDIYEWLGQPLPKPPLRRDLTRMADELVDAFERGQLVAVAAPQPSVETRTASETAPASELAPATIREEPRIDPAKTWIGLVLVDQDGNPMPTRGYRLVLPDGTVRESFFDARGRVHLDAIDPGTCTLTFVDLDVSDFKEPLPMKGGKSDGKGPVVAEGGDAVHIVSPGDTLATIAERAGFLHSSTIWNHAKNAELRRRRESPFVLLDGDGVVMPEKKAHAVQVGTSRETKFVVYVERTVARERARTFREDREIPLDETTVQVDGAADEGATRAGDVLDAPVPRDAQNLRADAPPAPVEFALGALMPVREARGVLTRLENLGFVPAEALAEGDEGDESEDDERIALACELFQESIHKKPTGEINDATIAALVDRVGA